MKSSRASDIYFVDYQRARSLNKMIYSKITGGLGNQMFQYAAARAVSLKLDTPLLLDTRNYSTYKLHQGFELPFVFNIAAELACEHDLEKYLRCEKYKLFRKLLSCVGLKSQKTSKFMPEPYFQYWNEIENVEICCYLSGYWQSEKYFSSFKNQIRRDFEFRQPISDLNAAISDEILSVNAVSVHIRRGDYITNPRANSVHGVCSINYYDQAISFMVQKLTNPKFFIFSDDPLWVKNNLKTDFTCKFIAHNHVVESYNDMRLMSLCKHHIIANSSFSWWGAWLNPEPEKLIVAPQNWFSDPNIDTNDLIPNDWKRLEN